jgi:hypothetical protein
MAPALAWDHWFIVRADPPHRILAGPYRDEHMCRRDLWRRRNERPWWHDAYCVVLNRW